MWIFNILTLIKHCILLAFYFLNVLFSFKKTGSFVTNNATQWIPCALPVAAEPLVATVRKGLFTTHETRTEIPSKSEYIWTGAQFIFSNYPQILYMCNFPLSLRCCNMSPKIVPHPLQKKQFCFHMQGILIFAMRQVYEFNLSVSKWSMTFHILMRCINFSEVRYHIPL